MGVSSKEEVLEHYNRIINTFLDDKMKLTKGEVRALALIMLMDNKDRTPIDREAMLLDFKTVKERIMFDMDVSKARLGNILTSLRKKGAIKTTQNGDELNPIFSSIINEEPPFNLNIVWHINKKEEI